MSEYSKEQVINIMATALQIENKEELSNKLEDVADLDDLTNSFSQIAKDRFKTVRQRAKKESYGRATREERTKVEELLSEKLGIEIDSDLETTLEKLPTILGSKDDAKSKNKSVTKEEALQHPEVRSILDGLKSQLQEKSTEAQKLAKDMQNFRLDSVLDSELSNALSKINADLSDDPKKRSTQLEAYKLLIKSKYNLGLDENGKSVVFLNDKGMPEVIDDVNIKRIEHIAKDTWIGGFKEAENNTQSPNNRMPNPSENSRQSLDFGYSSDDPIFNDQKAMLAEQQKARAAGDTKKAAFLRDKIRGIE